LQSLHTSAFRHIAKDRDDAEDAVFGILDRRRAAFDWALFAVLGDENGMVRESNDDSFARRWATRIASLIR